MSLLTQNSNLKGLSDLIQSERRQEQQQKRADINNSEFFPYTPSIEKGRFISLRDRAEGELPFRDTGLGIQAANDRKGFFRVDINDSIQFPEGGRNLTLLRLRSSKILETDKGEVGIEGANDRATQRQTLSTFIVENNKSSNLNLDDNTFVVREDSNYVDLIQNALSISSSEKQVTRFNSLLTQQTNLRSLKYGDFNKSNPVTYRALKDGNFVSTVENRGGKFYNFDDVIDRPSNTSTKALSIESRIRAEDSKLIANALTTPQGVKFLGNQAILNLQDLNLYKYDFKELLKRASTAAKRTAGVSTSAISQAAAEGTGFREVQGLFPLGKYLSTDPNLNGQSALLGEPIVDTIEKSIHAPDVDQINKREQPTGKLEEDKIKQYYTSITNSKFLTKQTKISGKIADVSNEQLELVRKAYPRIGDPKIGTIRDSDYFRENFLPTGDFTELESSDAKKEKHIKISGKDPLIDNLFFTISRARNGEITNDNINILDIKTEEIGTNDGNQIIPFKIVNYKANTSSPDYLYFRAYLDSLQDNFSGNWNKTQYIGRAEELFNYTGFKRSISFDFKIAAYSQRDLKPLYEKLNLLVGTTAPTYKVLDSQSLFMQGVFTRITIGDYMKNIPGVIEDINLSWNDQYPWEIKESIIVPHILDVSVQFSPIHDFNPSYGKSFIGFDYTNEIKAINE